MNAQNIVAILILVVVCIFAVRSCLNKKAHGCCGSGEAKLKVRDKNPDHYPYTAEISVEGMTCSNCKMRVENAFHERGTMWASVDLKSGTATVRMKEPATEEQLENLVKRAGYTATSVKLGQA